MKTVIINQQPVELFKVLKFEGLVSSGGAAKTVIADGLVRVNGEIETRKRKKLLAGDIIEFGTEKVCLQLDPAGLDAESGQ
ncbi:MAG: RNA-binding S4 domain-containing protein [Gammaproteobacteria bacterium]|jgi:ribosome-associated protein|nr:RNA-binding S4 domain-containing protein [Gammaproteobacteria bacterium]MBL6999669.1 RNA-binding S4 domain-containing protein [Gammaproteobacteria bacterium]